MNIKSLKIKIAEKLLSKYRLLPVKAEEINRQKLRDQVFPEWADWFSSSDKSSDPQLNVVIFSMNRALQLQALLESYKLHSRSAVSVNIIFKADSERHLKAYQKVFTLNSEIINTVYQEKNRSEFRTILLNILSGFTGTHLLFLVDDIIFIRSVDFSGLLSIDPRKMIFSLRLGKNLTHCYTQNIPMPLPVLTAGKLITPSLEWKWNTGVSDWNYPISVDGHLFSLDEMKILIRSVQFSKPNSFEESLQIFQPWFEFRTGVCFELPVIVNNPANKVQTENQNRAGSVSADDMLVLWERGYRIDVSKLSGMVNKSCHEEFEFPVKREDN